MRMSALADKTDAIIRRDVLTAMRYRTGFLITAAGAAVELAAFYYLARAIGPGFRPESTDYFLFLLVGTGLYTFLVTGTNAFLMIVQEAQQTGTLEVLMTTATPAPTLLFLSAVSAFAGNTVQLVLYVGAGLWLSGNVAYANWPACVVIFVQLLLISISLGMVAAALQLAVQKGSALVWLLGSGAWFMTGTVFPVSALPRSLSWLAQAIPVTHALTGMRMALLQGASWSVLSGELCILTAWCAILLPLSLLIFTYALRRARIAGTLSFY